MSALRPAGPFSLCVACRTVVRPGTECDLHGRAAVHPIDGPGREKIVEAVWTASRRSGHFEDFAIVVGLVGFSVGMFSASHFGPIAWAIVLPACLVLLALFYVRDRRAKKPLASGAPDVAVSVLGAVHGTVAAMGVEEGELVAEQTELSLEDGSVTLRDGWCREMAIVTDDDRRIVIPAGRARIQSIAADATRLSEEEVAVVLDAIERDGASLEAVHGSAELGPFPFDRSCSVRIRVGDRVGVAGELQIAPSEDGSAGFRTVSTVLRPTGVPILAIVERRPAAT